MLTFDRAESLFASARNKDDGKPLDNNTRLRKVDADTYAVRLHQTNIVLIHRDGTYTLNNGGWQTAVTKDRINQYTPAGIYQREREWYLNDGGKFSNGVKIDATGQVVLT